MRYDLITDADYATLPLDNGAKWLTPEAICRRNLNALIDDQSTQASDQNLKMQYMSIVASAAEELGVPGIKYPTSVQPADKFDDFMINVASVTTKQRLKSSGFADQQSVLLRSNTKVLIEKQISRLKQIIIKSDLPEKAKTRLLNKLVELSSEISRPRVSFGGIFAVLAVLGVGVSGGASFLADAPEAISTITALIGVDKEAEEAEISKLGLEKPKALPAPQLQIPHTLSDDSDEIPF